MEKTEIQNLIKELIQNTTVSVNEINIEEKSPKSVWFSVEVDQPHFFTSRGGEALTALNHLVRRIIETKITPESPDGFDILIDINGFQKKRIENIHTIAHMMAERSRYFKSSIEVEPMSAFDRRIVHEFLAEATDVKTESTGEGFSRRVVIKYIGNI
ncbi:MAG: R3H domain-containing nucleic acid-binding protein [Patescibacteria group bacterium]